MYDDFDPWTPDGNPNAEYSKKSSFRSNANCIAQRMRDNDATELNIYQEGLDELTDELAKEEGPFRLHPYMAFVVAGPPEFTIETHPHLTCLKKHLPRAYIDQYTHEKEDVRQLLAMVQRSLDKQKSNTKEIEKRLFNRSDPDYIGDRLNYNMWNQFEMQALKPITLCEAFWETRWMLKSVSDTYGISPDDLDLLWLSVGACSDDEILRDEADFAPTLMRISDQYGIPPSIDCLPHGSSLLHAAAEAGLVDVFRFLFKRIRDEDHESGSKDEINRRADDVDGETAPTALTSILTRQNRFGDTILIGCIRECQPEILRVLLTELATPPQVRAFIDLTNHSGQNCLSMAALVVTGYYSDEKEELQGAEMFKLCVDAGADLNLENPKNGDTALLKLCRYQGPDNDGSSQDGATSQAREICLRYLLEESPRHAEVDFRLNTSSDSARFNSASYQNEPPRTAVEEVLRVPSGEARRIVLAAAARREERAVGFGDPTNVLQISKAKKRRGGWAGWGGLGRHLPRSDPPPSGTLCCGARVKFRGLTGRSDLNGSTATLVRYGEDSGRWACKLSTAEESTAEESAAANSGMVKVKVANLEVVIEPPPASGLGEGVASGRHQLPRRGRVLRHRKGAEIADPSALEPPIFFGYSCADTCAVVRHLPRTPCPCIEKGRPCLSNCPSHCSEANPRNDVVLEEGTTLYTGKVTDATACAMAHLPTVLSLTPEQLDARYTLACIERWGESRGWDHQIQDDDQDQKGTVSLRALLYGNGSKGYFEGCISCGSDGSQRFCFCMNRAVNSNYVQHCFSCGKCFYIRHGTQRCPYCKALDPAVEGFYHRKGESKWAWELPSDEFEEGLASEGYWGF